MTTKIQCHECLKLRRSRKDRLGPRCRYPVFKCTAKTGQGREIPFKYFALNGDGGAPKWCPLKDAEIGGDE